MTVQLSNVSPNEASKLPALMADESFVNALFDLNSDEEAQRTFASKNANFTLEEIAEIRKAFTKASFEKNDEELSEEDLADITGGAWYEITFNITNEKTGKTKSITIHW